LKLKIKPKGKLPFPTIDEEGKERRWLVEAALSGLSFVAIISIFCNQRKKEKMTPSIAGDGQRERERERLEICLMESFWRVIV